MLKTEKLHKVLIIAWLASGSYYGYIGYLHTWWHFGLYVFLPAVLLFSALISAVINLKDRNVTNWFRWFASISTLVFLALILAHHITEYKPTVKVFIASDFEGTVTLLPGKVYQTSYHATEKGIVYFNTQEEVHLEIYHGDREITNVLNEAGYSQLRYFENDSNWQYQIVVQCFEVTKDRVYPTSPWNQKHAKCIKLKDFEQMVAQNVIDRSKVCVTKLERKDLAFYPIKGQCF